MGITNKFSLHAIQLDDTADVLIGGITSQGLSIGSEVRAEVTGGGLYPEFMSLTAQNPTAQFGTYHLATALANIGQTGLSIGGLDTGLVLWLQKHLAESTREATLKHRKQLLQAGMVVPRTLSVGAGGDAVLSYEIIATYDGVNDPVVITDLQTLPTAEPDDERFTLGPMQIGGKTLSHFRQFDVDFGISVVVERDGVDIWPTFVSIEQIAPVITCRGIDPEWLKSTNIPLAGLACTHANTIMFLRKRAAGGTFVIDATAEHIKLTGAGLATIEGYDATGSGAAETSLVLPLYYDAVNLPLVVNTASAIT